MSILDVALKLKFKYFLFSILLIAFAYSVSAQTNGEFLLSGNISSIGGKSGTDVKITLVSVNETLESKSDEHGYYQIVLKADTHYDIKLEKNTTMLNGLSTIDMVLMSRTIQGLEPSNCHLIFAMDLNEDKIARANDLVEFRKKLLGIESIYRDKFKFLPPLDYYDMNCSYLYQEPIHFSYFEIQSEGQDVVKDFTIIKLGDLDDSADY